MESFCTRYSPLVGDVLNGFGLNTNIFTFLTFCTKICRKFKFVKIALDSMQNIKMGLFMSAPNSWSLLNSIPKFTFWAGTDKS